MPYMKGQMKTPDVARYRKEKKGKLRHPMMTMDWDENRRVVHGVYGNKMVLMKDRAKEVYEAGVRVWEKRRKRKK